MGKILEIIIRDGAKYWGSFYLLKKPNVGCADLHCHNLTSRHPLTARWALDSQRLRTNIHTSLDKSTGCPSNVNGARYVPVLFLKTTTKRLESVQLEEWVRTHAALFTPLVSVGGAILLQAWVRTHVVYSARLSGRSYLATTVSSDIIMFVYSACSSGRSYLATSVSLNTCLFTPFV